MTVQPISRRSSRRSRRSRSSTSQRGRRSSSARPCRPGRAIDSPRWSRAGASWSTRPNFCAKARRSTIPPPRSHRGRFGKRRRGRAVRQALRIAAKAGVIHLALQRRADQVRLQRVSRAQDQLRQRNRQPVRRARRDLGRRVARDRLRPPHRSQFLSPGIGFGGPCFEKDVKSIEHVAAKHNMGRELFRQPCASTMRSSCASRNWSRTRVGSRRRFDDRRLGPGL